MLDMEWNLNEKFWESNLLYIENRLFHKILPNNFNRDN